MKTQTLEDIYDSASQMVKFSILAITEDNLKQKQRYIEKIMECNEEIEQLYSTQPITE